MRDPIRRTLTGAFALLATALVAGPVRASHSPDYEVWLVDQSNSAGVDHGGTVYVYDGRDLARPDAGAARPTSVIDLGAETTALCVAATGVAPARPHMIFFNSRHTHSVLSFVASGHVVLFDAPSRRPVACLRMSAGAGGARQAHAAFPAADDSYILVANQNGKLLERIDTDYAAGSFVHNPAATLDLAACTTPNGHPCEAPGVRPDNAPICPIISSSARRAFVTLRGGGLLVVDPRTTPMTILGEYDAATVHPNGCGGAEAGPWMYLNSGGGTGANLSEFDVYRFPLRGFSPSNPPNVPAPAVVFSDDATPDRDSHGMAVTLNGLFLWVADRAANVAEVFFAPTGRHLHTIDLVGPASDDPTPDLVDVSPDRRFLFVSLRGPVPLSGDPHASTGTTPGLGIIRLGAAGSTGALTAVVRISNIGPDGVERADAHGVRVRLKRR
jgi:hypothetical protein